MELRRRFDIRRVVIVAYILAFVVYLLVGLMPVGAAEYVVSDEIEIPSIGLESDVTELRLEDHVLNTPDTIVGSYTRAYNKTLLIGYATTVFQDLNLVEVGAEIYYNGKTYVVNEITLWRKEGVEMDRILAGAEQDTIMIMTCAGEIHGIDASHRLVLTAVAK